MSETKKVLLTKKHEVTGLGSFHKVIPAGIYEVVSYANVYKIVSDGIYKGDNLPKELCQIAKEYSIEYVTKLEIKAARGDQELERLRKELEEKEELAEKRLLEAKDWEDEYHALKRRYEESDKSALEKHELLMYTSSKFQAVSKELEEARKEAKRLRDGIEPLDDRKHPMMPRSQMARIVKELLGQEGEGNQ
ncbi:hypothetical protein [Paenibacillus xylanexedens]|uniref:hypothetical protein n=1 Tax=Paenibacillus xylanexedens TaxID=528191 RepID=UPI000F5228F3|nr:hypothetical protein [Paenibacillus xylanexedens]RPK29848.1 hypothetical protein EDO6_00472 [Paenibacillus xylanexedens]